MTVHCTQEGSAATHVLCRHSCVVSEGLGRSEALCTHMLLVFVASPDGTQWMGSDLSLQLSLTSASHELQTQGEKIPGNSLEGGWV